MLKCTHLLKNKTFIAFSLIFVFLFILAPWEHTQGADSFSYHSDDSHSLYAQGGPPFGSGRRRMGGGSPSGGPPPGGPAGMKKRQQTTSTESVAIRTDVHYDGPFFDAHAHVKPQNEEEKLDIVGKLHEARVIGMFLFGRNKGVEAEKVKHPTTVYPFAETPLKGSIALLNDDTVKSLEQQLQSGNFYGVGELPLRHGTEQPSHRADDPIMLKIYDLGAKYQAPVNIHFTYHVDHIGELEKALVYNPLATIIWAHVGSGPAAVATRLMDKYPNLYADISIRDPYLMPQVGLSLIDSQGNLKTEWQELFEAHPDRFFVGLDVWGADRAGKIGTLITYFRSVLGQLSAATAEKMAYQNAQALLMKKGVTLSTTTTTTTSTIAMTSGAGNIYTDVPGTIDTAKWYLFYLHGKAVEKGGRNAVTPGHGAYEYDNILKSLADKGFVVVSEVRPPDTNMEYGNKLVTQIGKLIAAGVPAKKITVAGHSKGGAITVATSAFLKNPDVNFVIMAGCGKGTQEKGYIQRVTNFAKDMKGKVLSLYDSADKEAGSCSSLFDQAKNLATTKETVLNTGLGHGVFYKPKSEWIDPLTNWAKGTP